MSTGSSYDSTYTHEQLCPCCQRLEKERDELREFAEWVEENWRDIERHEHSLKMDGTSSVRWHMRRRAGGSPTLRELWEKEASDE